MIETKNITKVLGEKLVLRGVNLELAKGDCIALLGGNGAGKSTWLKITAGLLKPTDGRILLNGKERSKDDFDYQRQIGYLGHQGFLYDAFSPVENLAFFAKLYSLKSPEKRIHELIEQVGLSYFKYEPVRTFSRGMVQRLSIARTLLHEPDILLLDEPYTGLDQQAVKLLNQLICEQLDKKVTIVIVTHDFDHIKDVCNRVVVLKKGKIVEDEPINGRSTNWIHELYSGEGMTS